MRRKIAFTDAGQGKNLKIEQILLGAAQQKHIRFSDYVTYNQYGSLDHQQSVNALQAAQGGNTNWSAAQGPFTYDYNPDTGEFVKDANGNHSVLNRYPAVGFNDDGMVLANGAKKLYGVTKYPGQNIQGLYYWNNITAEAVKVTLRLENEHSAFQITLKDASDGREMNISYGGSFVFAQTYADHQFGYRQNREDGTAWWYYPGSLEVGVFYDLLLKKYQNRMVLYVKKETDDTYIKVLDYKPMGYTGTTNHFQIQANPSDDILLGNIDTNGDGIIDVAGRISKTVSRVTFKEIVTYTREV